MPTPTPDGLKEVDDCSPSWSSSPWTRNGLTSVCSATGFAEHGSACWPEEGLTGSPAWLIDAEQQCLVPWTQRHTYITLSYVWGQVGSVETRKENLDVFQVPGAFSIENTAVVIPKTIRHALGLVVLLGQRYLWVDRLCICQDDPEMKAAQIDTMGDIYNNAIFTIIAANGWDADHGLRGIEGLTAPRNLPSQTAEQDFINIEPATSVWVR
jgi:hypothetical protein